ncbi:MAG: DUF1638 domain-containing protein [Actinobacteria bacterium]|nr:DUF1638 domain-containing protein [Actinomycetota bacterium]
MRLKVISCAVLEREFQLCASQSKNDIEVLLLEQGLHNTPDELRRRAQEAIDQTLQRDFDAIIMGYGLCCRGTVGLWANETRLVVPRGHDCITFLLGSKEKYREYFDTHPGIYWYSTGWIKHNDQPSRSRYEKVLAEYTAKYGEDNAKYLMETEQNWTSSYKLATYVDWNWPEAVQEREFTRHCAQEMGWSYDELVGDKGLLQRLVDGDWQAEEVLVLEPGEKVAESFDENILRIEQEKVENG